VPKVETAGEKKFFFSFVRRSFQRCIYFVSQVIVMSLLSKGGTSLLTFPRGWSSERPFRSDTRLHRFIRSWASRRRATVDSCFAPYFSCKFSDLSRGFEHTFYFSRKDEEFVCLPDGNPYYHNSFVRPSRTICSPVKRLELMSCV
jgi:hypothetical protein